MKKLLFVTAGFILGYCAVELTSGARAANGNVQTYTAMCNPDTGGTGLKCALVDSSGSIPVVSGSIPAAPITGQIVIAVTNTAVCLPSNALVNGLIVKAKTTNAGNGFVGPSGVTTTDDGTGNGYRIVPGEAWSGAVSNSSGVCVNGTANDVFYYTGN